MPTVLKAALDLGQSLGKGCWEVEERPQEKAKGFTPKVKRQGWLSQENAIDQELHQDLKPDSATVEAGGKVYTVGASGRYTTMETNTREAKSRNAGIRVLGMLAKVLEAAEVTDGELDLRILLPAGERKYFKKLQDQITKALYGVKLNGAKFDLTLKSVRVYPEGTGVAQEVPSSEALILMFGHKDISILPVARRVIQSEACSTLTGLGMIALLNEFPCSVNDELLLAELLHLESVGKGGLKRLVPPDELEEAKADFVKAKARIWRRIWELLNREPKIQTSPQIYVTGGSMRVWQKELKAAFGKRLTFFKSPLIALAEAHPDLDLPENKELKPRFTDSFLLVQGDCNA